MTQKTLILTRTRLFLLLCLCLLLSGCSSIKLGYNNLNWLAVWGVEDYVPLDDRQEDDLKGALTEHLEWHCETQLPEYVAWLEGLGETVNERDFARPSLVGHYAEALVFIERLGMEITPTAARLMASLDEEQIQTLFENLDERNAKRREKYLEPPLDEQIDQRAERLEERLERWFGVVTDEQRKLIEAWAEARGDQNRVWLEGRDQWQAALAEALQEPQAAGFESRVAQLLTDPGSVRSADHRATMARAQDQSIDLAQRVLAVSSDQQLVHLHTEIEALAMQLRTMNCEKG